MQTADLRGERLILPTDAAVRAAVRSELAASGVHDIESMDTTLSLVAYRLVDKGLGVALVEPFTAHAFQHHPGLAARRLAPTIPFKFGVLAPERRASSKTAREIGEIAYEALERMRAETGVAVTVRRPEGM